MSNILKRRTFLDTLSVLNVDHKRCNFSRDPRDISSVWIASFDIGSKNFAFYIEEFDRDIYETIKFPPVSRRYNPDGTCTSIFQIEIDKMIAKSRTVLFKNTDISGGKSYKSNLMNEELFNRMYDLLDKYKPYFDRCESFIVEQQMKCNMRAIKLGQHCLSYFVSNYGRFRDVVEFPAYYKTQVLGIQKTLKLLKNGRERYLAPPKPIRKKWAVVKALELLTTRNESYVGDQIKASSKRDDMSDCLVQLQAYKIRYIDSLYS
jgi:hypothetical protein